LPRCKASDSLGYNDPEHFGQNHLKSSGYNTPQEFCFCLDELVKSRNYSLSLTLPQRGREQKTPSPIKGEGVISTFYWFVKENFSFFNRSGGRK